MFLAVFLSTIVVAAAWAWIRRSQFRHETIHKLIESGRSIDQETFNRLLSLQDEKKPKPDAPSPNPRGAYGFAGFIQFMIGFGTILSGLLRDPRSLALVFLGMLPVVMAFLTWRNGDREYREGTLPALRNQPDPRESGNGAAFMFFLLGYATIFFGITGGHPPHYPVIVLGALVVVFSFMVFHNVEREYRQSRVRDNGRDD